MIRIAVVLTLVGCASSQKPDAKNGGDGSGSNVVCHEVTDTGSMFSHTECTPIEEKQEQKEDAQRWLKRPRNQPTK